MVGLEATVQREEIVPKGNAPSARFDCSLLLICQALFHRHFKSDGLGFRG